MTSFLHEMKKIDPKTQRENKSSNELTDRVTTFALGAEKQVVSDWLTVPVNFRNRLGPKLVALMENNMGFFFLVK